MATPCLEMLARGGSIWDAQRKDYGSSFVVSNNAPFKVALDGPNSNFFEDGHVVDGWLTLTSGPKACYRFATANQVMTAIRDASSNAYLYFWFLLDKVWQRADDLRHNAAYTLTPLEGRALKLELQLLGQQPDRQPVDGHPGLIILAAQQSLNRPLALQEAQRSLDDDVWFDAKFTELGYLPKRPKLVR